MPSAVGGGLLWSLRSSRLLVSALPSPSRPAPPRVVVSPFPPSASPTALCASEALAFVGATDGAVSVYAHRQTSYAEPLVRTAPLLAPVSALAYVEAAGGVFAAASDGALAFFSAGAFQRYNSERRRKDVESVVAPTQLLAGTAGGDSGGGSDSGGGVGGVGILSLAFDDDFLYVGAENGLVTVWDFRERVLVREVSLGRRFGAVSALQRAGPSALWVGFADGGVRVWDVCGDDGAGVEEVAAVEALHVAADGGGRGVAGFVRVASDEVWSYGRHDTAVLKWAVRMPSLLGAVEGFDAGEGEDPVDLVEVQRERREKVVVASIGEDTDKAIPLQVVDQPVVPLFSSMNGTQESASAAAGRDIGVSDGASPGANGRKVVSRAEWEPVGKMYDRAHATARHLLEVRDTMDPEALSALFLSVGAMTSDANEQLRRVSLSHLGPDADVASDPQGSDVSNGGGVDGVAGAKASENASKVAEPPADENQPQSFGSQQPRTIRQDRPVSKPFVDALSESLDRARALLPSVRLGDRRGPLAKELETAARLLGLWVAESRSTSDLGDRKTSADAAMQANHGAAVVSASERIASLRDCLDKSRQETKAAKVGLRDAQEEIASLRIAASSATKSRTVAETERDLLNQELKVLHAESSETITGLERTLDERAARIKSLKLEVEELGGKLKLESRDRDNLEIELHAKVDIIESLELAHRNAENALLEKSAELSSVEDKLEGEVHAMRHTLEEATEARLETNDALAAQSEELLVATSRLETAFGNISRLEEQAEVAHTELEETHERLSSAESSLALERSALAVERSALQECKLQLKNVQTALEEEASKRQEAEKILNVQIPSLSALADSVSERVDTESVELGSELAAAESRVVELEGRLSSCNERLAEVMGRSRVLEEQLNASNEEVECLRLAESSLTAAVEKGQSANIHLTEAMDGLKREILESEKENLKLNASLKELQARSAGFGKGNAEVVSDIAPASSKPSTDEPPASVVNEGQSLKFIPENCDPELEELRRVAERRETLLSECRLEVEGLKAERDDIREALDSQIAATAVIGASVADKEDICGQLQDEVAELRSVDTGSLYVGEDRIGERDPFEVAGVAQLPGEVASALADSARAVGDARRGVEAASSMAGLLQEYADKHRESLPVLLGLERELRRKRDLRRSGIETGTDVDLDSAVESISNMIAVLFTDNDKRHVLGSDNEDEFARFAPTPQRRVALQTQVDAWHAEQLSERLSRASPTPFGALSRAESADIEEGSAINPRRLLRF